MLRWALLLAVVAPEAQAASIVVNRNSDEADADPNDGVPDVDLVAPGMQVTLRAAIEQANQWTTSDEITFDLANPVLMPAELPEITGVLQIDGALNMGTVRIEGRGLVFTAASCSVTNLAIHMAPVDAIRSEEAISLSAIELTNSVTGFGVRASGDISIAGGVIGSNAKGGVFSWGRNVDATAVAIESNGGPGVMALGSVTLTAGSNEPIRVRSNGGGIWANGRILLDGAGLHQITGNFGDGIRTLNGVEVRAGLEVIDNASFGIRALLDISLGITATVSGNGHGFFAVFPNAIEMDPTFTMIMGDALRGGGMLSVSGSINGYNIVASDNAATGILADVGVSFARVFAYRNDGNGVEALDAIEIDEAHIEGNFGTGIFGGDWILLRNAIIADNAGAGLFGAAIDISGPLHSEIRRNGKMERATITHYDDTLAVSFDRGPPFTAGAMTVRFFGAVDIDIIGNEGDGVSCDTFDISSARINNNGGAGLRAVRRGSLYNTILCDNAGGDLVAFQPVELDPSSGACDREARIAAEGCDCTATDRGSGSILLLGLLLLLRKRKLLALFLLGCSAEPSYFFSPPPPPESASSVVFAVESEDRVLLEARSMSNGMIGPVTIAFDRLGRSQIWALYYERPLSAHGLAEGTVRPNDEGSPLDAPDRMYRAEFLGGELGEWQQSELSDRLRDLAVERAPPEDPCIRLGEERTFPLETHRDAAFALRVDGERALIATDDARLYLVTVDGVTPLGRAAPVRIESGYLTPNGELIVGAQSGRTFRGPFEPEPALVEIARNQSGDAFGWMDGPKSGGELELFAVTSSGAMEHFDGEAWTMLLPPSADDWRRGVAWIGSNEGVAVGLSAPIVRAKDGRIADEPIDGVEAMTSVEHVPGLGTFAGTLAGSLLMHDGDRWNLIPDSPIELPATAIAAFGRGVLVSGGTGQTAVWIPEQGFCQHLSVNSPIVKHAAVLDRAAVFLGDARDDRADPSTVSVVLLQ